MYRILLSNTNFPSGTYNFYKKTVTVTDETTGDITTKSEIYETDSMDELQTEYLEVIKKYPTAAVLPVDMLKTLLDVVIIDETT